MQYEKERPDEEIVEILLNEKITEMGVKREDLAEDKIDELVNDIHEEIAELKVEKSLNPLGYYDYFKDKSKAYEFR